MGDEKMKDWWRRCGEEEGFRCGMGETEGGHEGWDGMEWRHSDIVKYRFSHLNGARASASVVRNEADTSLRQCG